MTLRRLHIGNHLESFCGKPDLLTVGHRYIGLWACCKAAVYGNPPRSTLTVSAHRFEIKASAEVKGAQ